MAYNKTKYGGFKQNEQPALFNNTTYEPVAVMAAVEEA